MRTVRKNLLLQLLLILLGALPHIILAQYRTNNSLVFLEKAQAITATIEASKTQVCKGETPQPTITFTATGGTAPYTFTYSGNGTNKQKITTSGSNNSISINVNISNAGTIVYTLDSVAGSNETANAVTGQQASIKVNPPPDVDFSFTENQCSGSAVVFNPNITGSGVFTYLWDFGDGTSSTKEAPTHTYNSFGTGTQTFNVKLTIKNSSNCSNTLTKQVAIKKSPDASIDTTNTKGGALFDQTQHIFINCGATQTSPEYNFIAVNTSSTTSTNTGYSIDWGDNTPIENITTFTTLTHKYNSLGFFDLTITAFNTNSNCSFTKTYKVFNGNTPAGNLAGIGDTQDCVPYTLTWPVENTSNNTPGTTYIFSVNDGSPSQIFTQATLPTTISHTFTKSSCGLGLTNNKFTINFNVINPCGENPSTLTVQPTQKPVASFVINPTTKFCTNNTTTLTNTSIGNYIVGSSCTSNFNKTWSITPSSGWSVTQGSLTGSDDVLKLQFNTPGSYSIKLKINKPNSTPARCTEDSIVKNICVENPPNPVFNVDKNEGCAPLIINTTNATNENLICTGSISYKWTVGYQKANCGTTSSYTITNGNDATKNPVFKFTNPGIYKITLSATGTCGTYTSSEQTVSVKAPPTASINNISNACLNPGGTVISPTATVTDCSNSGLTYEWSFPEGVPASSTLAIPGNITYATPGDKTITLRVTNECSSVTVNKSFSISPSPTSNDIASQTKCAGTNTDAITFSGTNTLAYNWTNSNTSIGLAASGSGNIPAFKTVNTGNTEQTATITVTPVNGSCSGTPKTFSITVKPALKATATGSISMCKTQGTYDISFTGQNGTPPYTFTYQLNNGSTQTVSSPVGNATAKVTVDLKNAGTFTYKLNGVSDVSALSCTQSLNESVTVVVTDVPNITKTYTDTICNNTATTINPASDSENNVPAGTTYTWVFPTVSPMGAITGAIEQNTPVNTLTIPALINTTNAPAKVTYTVIPKTGNCNGVSFTIELTVQPSPVITFSETDQQICSGETSREVTLSTTSPGNVSYSWSVTTPTGVTGAAISGTDKIPAQTLINSTNTPQTVLYKAKAKLADGGSCDGAEYTYRITVNPTPAVTGIQNVSYCNNLQVSATPFTSNVSGATFSWENDNTAIGLAASGTGNLPAFTATNNGLTDLIAHIKVTPAANNCTGKDSTITITVHPSPTADQPANQIVCNGYLTSEIKFTGAISATVYNWTHNKPGIGLPTSGSGDIQAFAAINTGTAPITATFTVTPVFGDCNGAVKTFTITINPSPVFTSQPASESLCVNGTPKLLSVNYSDATSVPTYQWFENSVRDSITGTAITGQTQANYQPVGTVVGTKYYYCVLTFPSGGCTTLISKVAAITVNSMPVVSENPLSTQQICMGGNIQPLTVKYNGGSGTPQYQWYRNTLNLNTGGTAIPAGKSAEFTPPAFDAVGNYYYYVVINFADGGCGAITSQPAEIVVVTDPVVTSQPLANQTICQGSTAATLSVSASGGVGTFNYQWYEMTTTGSNQITGATQADFVPSTDVVGIRKYFCEISQTGLGCNATSNVSTVTVNKAPTFTIQPASAVYCKDETSVALRVAYKDGVGTAQYQWYSNTTNSNSGGTALTGENNESYTPPTNTPNTLYYYCVITLSEGGCSSLTSNVAEIKVNQYPVISDYNREIGSGTSFNVQPSPVSSSNIVPVGTTYTWTNPVISPLNAITGASAQNSPQTAISQTLTNNTKSAVTVTYTVLPVANGCAGATFTVTVKVNPPINANAVVNDISCNGANDGNITIDIEGGNPPYTILWSGPYGFTSDKNTISGLRAGDYTLKVTDNGGLPFNIIYNIKEPAQLSIVHTSEKDISCHGAANGSIQVDMYGGNEPYTFSWTKDNAAFSTSQYLENLSPGEYTVTINDKNNCGPLHQTFTITEPEALDIQLVDKTNNLCAGDKNGSIEVNVNGGVLKMINGVKDYNYQWTGPNGFTATTKNISGLYSGTYMLSVSDASGCSTQFSTQITEPDSVKALITTTPITCYGADDASITLDVSGGVAPYTAEWDNFSTGFYQPNLSAKDYTITITDANRCVKTIKVTIPEAPIFRITPIVKQITCHGANDGSIKLNMEGGQGKVKLAWSDGSTSGNERNNIGPGIYTVTITDDKPCSIVRTFIIQEPLELSVSAKVTDAHDCSVVNSGAIDLEISGGTEPYSINWSNGATTEDITQLAPGNYFVQVTDARGCIKQEQFAVARQLPLSINVEKSYSYDCAQQKITQLCKANISGGVPPYQISWSSGNVDTSESTLMRAEQTATVILRVTDALNCDKSVSFDTEIPHTGISYSTLDCNSHSYQFHLDYPDILFTNVRYEWNFGDGATSTIRNPQHTYLKQGTYDIKVKLLSNECNTTYKYRFFADSIPVLRLDKPAKLCKNDSVILHITGADFYNWSDGTSADSIIIRSAGDYSVTGTTRNGCTANLNFSATYYDYFNYSIQSDKNKITAEDATVEFWSDDIPLSKYYWNFGDGKTDTGNFIYHNYTVDRGGYMEVELTATNPYGCTEKATKKIWLSLDAMPNIFVPDAGGDNRVFLKGWNLQVFNSNGVLLYKGTDGWDGTYKNRPVSSDTYYYVVSVYSINGTESKPGFVTVVR